MKRLAKPVSGYWTVSPSDSKPLPLPPSHPWGWVCNPPASSRQLWLWAAITRRTSLQLVWMPWSEALSIQGGSHICRLLPLASQRCSPCHGSSCIMIWGSHGDRISNCIAAHCPLHSRSFEARCMTSLLHNLFRGREGFGTMI